jgi:hypothetical protein
MTLALKIDPSGPGRRVFIMDTRIDIRLFKKTLCEKIEALKTAHDKQTLHEGQFDELLIWIQACQPTTAATKAVQVVAVNVRGILYYVDAFQNVYKTEDILKRIDNPQIIGRAVVDTAPPPPPLPSNI